MSKDNLSEVFMEKAEKFLYVPDGYTVEEANAAVEALMFELAAEAEKDPRSIRSAAIREIFCHLAGEA